MNQANQYIFTLLPTQNCVCNFDDPLPVVCIVSFQFPAPTQSDYILLLGASLCCLGHLPLHPERQGCWRTCAIVCGWSGADRGPPQVLECWGAGWCVCGHCQDSHGRGEPWSHHWSWSCPLAGKTHRDGMWLDLNFSDYEQLLNSSIYYNAVAMLIANSRLLISFAQSLSFCWHHAFLQGWSSCWHCEYSCL